VFNGYCESDVEPQFIHMKATSSNGQSNYKFHNVAHTLQLTLKNVATSCLGNMGQAPCATDDGAAEPEDARFVCLFDSPGHEQTQSALVQAVRTIDTFAGQTMAIGSKLTCVMPERTNVDHDITVSLAYLGFGTTNKTIAYGGAPGQNAISIIATASPTPSPTANPTSNPTLDPTPSPTATPTASPTEMPDACRSGSPGDCTASPVHLGGAYGSTYSAGALIHVQHGHSVYKSTQTNSCPENWKVGAIQDTLPIAPMPVPTARLGTRDTTPTCTRLCS
jgi:hypothetical protein